MVGIGRTRSLSRAAIVLVGALLAVAVASGPPAERGQAARSLVQVEWLGHEVYRLTSSSGVVVVTSPWLANPDGPIAVEDLARTDVILVPNAHNDDMGNPIEVAAASGATV